MTLWTGIAGWPERFDEEDRSAGESAIGFNVRSWYNNGLDIHYRDGRVVGVSYSTENRKPNKPSQVIPSPSSVFLRFGSDFANLDSKRGRAPFQEPPAL